MTRNKSRLPYRYQEIDLTYSSRNLNTNRSIAFPRELRSDTGRKFEMHDLSLLLCKGMTFALFHIDGKQAVCSEVLKSVQDTMIAGWPLPLKVWD